MILVSSCSSLCLIHWCQVLSREWRCSWSSADRQCSNYIWVISNFIAYSGAPYITGLAVILQTFHTHSSMVVNTNMATPQETRLHLPRRPAFFSMFAPHLPQHRQQQKQSPPKNMMKMKRIPMAMHMTKPRKYSVYCNRKEKLMGWCKM